MRPAPTGKQKCISYTGEAQGLVCGFVQMPYCQESVAYREHSPSVSGMRGRMLYDFC